MSNLTTKLAPNIFRHEPEVWDAKKCLKISKRKCTDAYGTKDHLAGFLHDSYGVKMYNGGCVRDGEWYEGENYPTPTVAKGFEIIYVRSWFFRLIKK